MTSLAVNWLPWFHLNVISNDQFGSRLGTVVPLERDFKWSAWYKLIQYRGPIITWFQMISMVADLVLWFHKNMISNDQFGSRLGTVVLSERDFKLSVLLWFLKNESSND